MSQIHSDLHRLVDQLPEAEAYAALRYLEFLRDRGGDPLLRALAQAPLDDEPVLPEEAEAIQEAEAAIARGEERSWDEVKEALRGGN